VNAIQFDEEPNYFKLQRLLKQCFLLARDFKKSNYGETGSVKYNSVLYSTESTQNEESKQSHSTWREH